MRPSKPWFRKDRDAWYVQHNGRQVFLAKGKANKPDALAAYHKLMLIGSQAPASPSLPVATLCDLFLDHSQTHHAPHTYTCYKAFLQDFCQSYGRFNAADMKPFHVNRWVDGKKTWDGAKRHGIIVVKRVFSWAEQEGLLAASPLRMLKAPRAKCRDRVLTAEEKKLILDNAHDPAFHTFLRAMMGTGCRPAEVALVTAAHVNLEVGIWLLPEHKTRRKTGKPRVIYLSPDMLELSRQQIAAHPTGPLFPNLRGKAFDNNSWRCRFRRLREKFPQLAGVVCYTLRHSYATDALIKGVGIAQVAELMGHTSTEMVSRVYGHIAANVAHMRDAAAKATG